MGPALSTRRRWFQFHLRTLLIFMLLASCGLGWLGLKVQRAKEQRLAVEMLTRQTMFFVDYDYQLQPGGVVSHAVQPPGPEWLRKLLGEDIFGSVVHVYHLIPTRDGFYLADAITGQSVLFQWWREQSGWMVSDEQLMALHSLPDLKSVGVGGWRMTDDKLKLLSGLPSVRQLYLNNTDIQGSGLVHLQTLPQLQELDLSGTYVTDANLVHLEKFSCLRKLDLTGSKVAGTSSEASASGDHGLKNLSQLVQLESLTLDHLAVRNEHLQQLTTLVQLRALSLNGTEITDAGLANISKWPKLEVLSLGKTQVTDVGLEQLLGLSQLQSIDLRRSETTVAGRQKLRQALPNTKIEPSP